MEEPHLLLQSRKWGLVYFFKETESTSNTRKKKHESKKNKIAYKRLFSFSLSERPTGRSSLNFLKTNLYTRHGTRL